MIEIESKTKYYLVCGNDRYKVGDIIYQVEYLDSYYNAISKRNVRILEIDNNNIKLESIENSGVVFLLEVDDIIGINWNEV